MRMMRKTSQETFVKAWKNIGKFRLGENFRTWLFAIAHNTAIDRLRKKKVLVFSDFENDEGDNTLLVRTQGDILGPEEVALLNERKDLVSRAIDELPPLYREVL